MEMKLELIILPVSDVDRAKDFYANTLGFNLDQDNKVGDKLRFVQLTPLGSACSIAIGTGLTDAAPGSVKGMQVVVTSAKQAHEELKKRGVEVSDVEEHPWGTFVYFSDPDGNAWSVQELPPR
ncbi:MAG TPA: glyoxalase superfamily protein [Candidatus Saccharimonadales bacterium]|nr:glyoxalase superfamily protein [Candidatus Saccharimonadales bacterium]